MSRAFIILAAVLAVTATAGQEARAELLSSRPITVINPFTPGASSDTLQRIVNKKVSEDTGQTLVVESRPGGGGIVAAAVVKQASPDGHTLLQANAGTHATNASLYATLPYDPIKDFRPITLMWSFPQLLAVPHDSPATSGSVSSPRPETPDAVIDKLNAAFVRAVRDPNVVKQMTEQGAEAVATTPAEFAAFIASETERFGKVVRAVGAKAE